MSGNSRLYSWFLHGVLIALAICSILLVRQNRLLVDRLTPPRSQSAFHVGEPLPSFEVQEAGSGLRRLSFAATQRPTLLFFFNTTCGACRENQTHWRELYHALGDSTAVIGVSLDGPGPTRAYVEQMGLPFPTVSVADPESVTRNLGITQIPETVLVDTQGKVAEAWLGILSDDDLQRLGLDS